VTRAASYCFNLSTGFRSARHSSNRYASGSQQCAQHLPPWPLGPWSAAIKIEGSDANLRIGMTGQVRFGQQKDAGDATGIFEAMPGGLTHHAPAQAAYAPFPHHF